MIAHLTAAEFRDKIFNYQESQEFKYTGELPVIIDFYANWCGPCKMISPILEELAVVYQNQITFYKVDTEKETELSQIFGIRSIPSILYIPLIGGPSMDTGVRTKEQLEEIIFQVLGIKKPVEPKELEA